jgi:hypothetical protein
VGLGKGGRWLVGGRVVTWVSCCPARPRPAPPPPPPPRVVKIVRAIRNGWIKTRKQKAAEAKQEQEVYLLWGDDDQVGDCGGCHEPSGGLMAWHGHRPPRPGRAALAQPQPCGGRGAAPVGPSPSARARAPNRRSRARRARG